ncbi:rhomboid family intramembrane serine protease [Pandoraea communis]|uniref:Membrane protein n=1 Tax=Pandoraea communis TaxID=2508297 RepID=A0A5E4USR7_9BURK|nr:rhomboid family intramembrane serine protease [Pandoraea communis]MDM8358043.1 rhomboid family intramembrane serine protease [Pandoraea communis]VVE03007.1 membrane protein [Pandoraea communis]
MTQLIVLVNVVAFLLQLAVGEASVNALALWPLPPISPVAAATSLSPYAPSQFHVWQLLTYSLLHSGWVHLAFNMWGLYLFGRDIESELGSARLLMLYAGSVVSAGLTQLIVTSFVFPSPYPTVGASGGVFGLLLGFAALFPRRTVVLLIPPIPIPAWLFATLYGVAELALGVSGSLNGVAHFAHLGGMLGSAMLMLYWRRHKPEQRAEW